MRWCQRKRERRTRWCERRREEDEVVRKDEGDEVAVDGEEEQEDEVVADSELSTEEDLVPEDDVHEQQVMSMCRVPIKQWTC